MPGECVHVKSSIVREYWRSSNRSYNFWVSRIGISHKIIRLHNWSLKPVSFCFVTPNREYVNLLPWISWMALDPCEEVVSIFVAGSHRNVELSIFVACSWVQVSACPFLWNAAPNAKWWICSTWSFRWSESCCFDSGVWN